MPRRTPAKPLDTKRLSIGAALVTIMATAPVSPERLFCVTWFKTRRQVSRAGAGADWVMSGPVAEPPAWRAAGSVAAAIRSDAGR